MLENTMYDFNSNYEESKQFQIQVIELCFHKLPTIYNHIVTEEETHLNSKYKNMLLNLYENFIKLDELIKVVNNNVRFNISFELTSNIHVLCFIIVSTFNSISPEEKREILNRNTKELRKTTQKVNSYYNKYILKPHEKKKRKSKYVTLNSNNIYSGIVENIYKNNKNNFSDPNSTTGTVRPEEIETEIKEKIRKCI